MNLEKKRELFKKDLYGLVGLLHNNLVGIKIDNSFIHKAKDIIINYKLSRSTTLLANLNIYPELQFDSGNAELIIKFDDRSKCLIMEHFETNGLYWLDLEENEVVLEDPIFDMSMLVDNDPMQHFIDQIDEAIRPSEPMIFSEMHSWGSAPFTINENQPTTQWIREYPVGTNGDLQDRWVEVPVANHPYRNIPWSTNEL